MECTIEIKGNRAYLKGTFPTSHIRELTSYPVQGANFSLAYKRGKWDGRKHLFNLRDNSMPAGLVSIVRNSLENEFNAKVTLIDNRLDINTANAGIGVKGKLEDKFGKGIFDYQLLSAESAVAAKRGILKLATNAGKTVIAGAIINHLQIPTLFIVPGVELLYQAQEALSEFTGQIPEEVGLIGDGHFSIGSWVTVAIVDTLVSRLADKEQAKRLMEANWQLLFLDECHVAGSDTTFAALDAIPAYYRFGLSGTPLDRSDGATLRLIAQTGEIIYEVKNKLLVERGISVQPVVKLMTINEPKIPKTRNKLKVTYAEAYDEAYVNNLYLNQKVVETLIPYLDEGKSVIIMIDRIEHGENIKNIIDNTLYERWEKLQGVHHNIKFIHGSQSSDERKEALTAFKNGEINCLITTSILNQGVDIDCIDLLCFAGGGKAVIPTLQRVGRGLRSGRGREKLIIIDIINNCHQFFSKHANIRLDTYKSEECFQIEQIT